MLRFTKRQLPWLALSGLLVAGCHSAETPIDAPQANSSAPVTPVVNSTARNPTPAAGQTTAAAKPANDAPFTPPFPGRADLFDAPRGGQSVVRRDEEHGGTVELKGFIDVNGPQVVLAIDGILSPIPEGGEKYGVQVISIKPPQVVLQRGRSRWTASLE